MTSGLPHGIGPVGVRGLLVGEDVGQMAYASLFLFSAFQGEVARASHGTRCEFLLTREYARPAVQMFESAVTRGIDHLPAFFDDRPTRRALEFLKLPYGAVRSLEMSIQKSRTVDQLFWVEFSATLSRRTVTRVPVHFPPMFVWKAFDGRADAEDIVELDISLESEDLDNLEMGTAFDQTQTARRFFSFTGLGSGRPLKLTYGLDVACNQLGSYAHSTAPEFVAVGETVLCRIRALTSTQMAAFGR